MEQNRQKIIVVLNSLVCVHVYVCVACPQVQVLLSNRLNPDSLLQPTGYAAALVKAIQTGGPPAATVYTQALAAAFAGVLLVTSLWLNSGHFVPD